MTHGMIAELTAGLDALEMGLTLSGDELKARLEHIQKEKEHQIETQAQACRQIDDRLEKMRRKQVCGIEEVLDQMQEQTESLTQAGSEDLMKYYTFYCIDTIQEALNRCVDYHTVLIYDELEAISGELTAELSKSGSCPAYGFRFALDNRTWTMGDNVSFVVSKIRRTGSSEPGR